MKAATGDLLRISSDVLVQNTPHIYPEHDSQAGGDRRLGVGMDNRQLKQAIADYNDRVAEKVIKPIAEWQLGFRTATNSFNMLNERADKVVERQVLLDKARANRSPKLERLRTRARGDGLSESEQQHLESDIEAIETYVQEKEAKLNAAKMAFHSMELEVFEQLKSLTEDCTGIKALIAMMMDEVATLVRHGDGWADGTKDRSRRARFGSPPTLHPFLAPLQHYTQHNARISPIAPQMRSCIDAMGDLEVQPLVATAKTSDLSPIGQVGPNATAGDSRLPPRVPPPHPQPQPEPEPQRGRPVQFATSSACPPAATDFGIGAAMRRGGLIRDAAYAVVLLGAPHVPPPPPPPNPNPAPAATGGSRIAPVYDSSALDPALPAEDRRAASVGAVGGPSSQPGAAPGSPGSPTLPLDASIDAGKDALDREDTATSAGKVRRGETGG